MLHRVLLCCALVVFALTVPTRGAVRIEPMGDSITYGVGVPGGYRTQLYQDLSAAGLSVQLVGNSSDNASSVLSSAGQAAHNGVPWFTTANVIDALNGPIDPVPGAPYGNSGNWLSVTADVILLDVGTNNLGVANQTPQQAAAGIDALVGDLTAALPDARLIVSTITPRNDYNQTAVVQLNALIPGIVQSHASAGEHVSLVDLFSAIDPTTDLSADGVHPDAAGYEKIGNAWATAVEAAVPEPACLGSAAAAVLLLARRRR